MESLSPALQFGLMALGARKNGKQLQISMVGLLFQT
jgi:hypothetical protein